MHQSVSLLITLSSHRMHLVPHNSNRSRRLCRRGVGTLLFMVFLAIFVMLLMLVVNYTYLAYSQLRTGDVTASLARIAVTELLDEGRLQATPTASPAAQVTAAIAAVQHYNHKFNATAGTDQQLRFDPNGSSQDNDILVAAGRIDNVTLSVTDTGAGSTFRSPAGDEPFNTLKVEAARTRNGSNPLYLLVRAAFTPQAADIGTTSFATLDSRLLGFRPTLELSTPIVPIAIQANAWPVRTDVGGIAARHDFVGRLRADGSGNLALINFDQTASPNVAEIADQIELGTFPTHINVTGSDYLGPLAEGVESQTFAGDVLAPANGSQIASTLELVADSNNPRRIFPLYDSFTQDEARVVGFVSATVLGATWAGSNLTIELEPEFLLHPTAVTAPEYAVGMNDPVSVPENVYIHKLRLSR